MNASSFLLLKSCKALATNSFPVPLSPRIITVKSVETTFARTLYTSCMTGDLPTIGRSSSELSRKLFLALEFDFELRALLTME